MGATHYHEAVRSSSPPETPLVIPPGILASGRARAALPLRREGPEKLTGLAKYADDLVFPGAWYGATIRSTEPHARLLGIDLDPEYDWSKVVVITAKDIPGDNVVSLIQDDQPVLVAVGGEIQHQAEPVCLLAAPDRAILRAAKHHVTLRTERLPAVFDPLLSDREFAHFELGKGDVEAGLAAADIVVEGEYRVGHQEQLYIENQAMIAVPRPRRRGRGPRLDAVPVLHPRRPETGTEPDRCHRRWSSRPRRAAGSAARRNTPRSSPSTPPCWRSGSASRSA